MNSPLESGASYAPWAAGFRNPIPSRAERGRESRFERDADLNFGAEAFNDLNEREPLASAEDLLVRWQPLPPLARLKRKASASIIAERRSHSLAAQAITRTG